MQAKTYVGRIHRQMEKVRLLQSSTSPQKQREQHKPSNYCFLCGKEAENGEKVGFVTGSATSKNLLVVPQKISLWKLPIAVSPLWSSLPKWLFPAETVWLPQGSSLHASGRSFFFLSQWKYIKTSCLLSLEYHAHDQYCFSLCYEHPQSLLEHTIYLLALSS